jgi:hypothetical protein
MSHEFIFRCDDDLPSLIQRDIVHDSATQLFLVLS